MLLSSGADAQSLDARRAFDKGDYATALTLFQEANQSKPACPNFFYIGLARYRLKQVDESLIAFRAAVQCDPKMVDAYLALGEAYLERRNQGEALAAYTEALAQVPDHPAALRGAITLYLANEVKDKALPLLERLVEVDKKDAQARVDLAAVYGSNSDRTRAEKQLLEALRVRPKFPPALTALGNLYFRSNEDDRAIPLLKEAAELQPKAHEPHYLLGAVYNRHGQFEQAVAELERALQLGGSEAELYYHLARAYGGVRRAEDRRKALAKFSEISRRSREDAEAQRNSKRLVEEARTLLQSGDLNGAAAKLEQARESTPGDATLLFRLAGLHYDLERLDTAREYVRAAISISPSTWLYHYLLGLIEKSSARWIDARESLNTAQQLNPSAAEVLNALADLPKP